MNPTLTKGPILYIIITNLFFGYHPSYFSFQIDDIQGKYLLLFAENRTVCQYLLQGDEKIQSLDELKKISRTDYDHLEITRSNATVFTLKPSSLFELCMLYSNTLESDRCITSNASIDISNIKCGIFDGNWNYGKSHCMVEWKPARQEFQILVNSDSNNSDFINPQSNYIGTYHKPIFGKLECKIKDTEYSLKTFTYEAPFLIGHLYDFQNPSQGRAPFSSVYQFLPIIFFLIVTIALCFGVLKYRAQNHQKGILQEWR